MVDVVDAGDHRRPAVGSGPTATFGLANRPRIPHRRSRWKARFPAGIEQIIFALCIFLLSSPFTFTLISQDPATPVVRNIANMRQADNSQLLLYVVRLAVLLVAFLFMLPRWRIALGQWRQLLPLAPFTVWAALSIIWSDDIPGSTHSVLALIALVLASYLIALRLSPLMLTRAILLAGLIMGLFSCAYAIFLPSYGVHQITDAAQFVHAGSWRGVYIHKNFLGHVAAIFASATFWASPAATRSRIWKWGLFCFLIFLAVMTNSASAVAMVFITIAIVWALGVAKPATRLKTILFGAPILLVGYLSVGAVLHSLGRDATFSGRNVVWGVAMDSFLQRPFTGYGYVSMTYGDFSYQLMRLTDLFDPHNSYFDIALGTGTIGLILYLIPIAASWSAARRLYLAEGMERQVGLALFSMVVAWLVSSMTETGDRPFTAMGGLGLFGVAALLSLSVSDSSAKGRRGKSAQQLSPLNDPRQSRRTN